MWGAGRWVLGAGCWMMEAGRWKLEDSPSTALRETVRQGEVRGTNYELRCTKFLGIRDKEVFRN